MPATTGRLRASDSPGCAGWISNRITKGLTFSLWPENPLPRASATSYNTATGRDVPLSRRLEGALWPCLDRRLGRMMGEERGVRDQERSLVSVPFKSCRGEVRAISTGRVKQDSGVEADWMAQGKCWEMDPAVFFPTDGIGVAEAQRICLECPVKATCLEYALANRIPHGVWGGTSERERQRILRQRKRSQRQPTLV